MPEAPPASDGSAPVPARLTHGPGLKLVALSAAYGAGGSVIGPALAERLDVPFVDRGIQMAVAHRLEIPVDDAIALEQPQGGNLLQRRCRPRRVSR